VAQHVARRGWVVFVVVFVVVVGAVGTGVLLRDLRPAAGAGGVGSTGSQVPPRPPEPGPAVVVLTEDVMLHPDADRIHRVLQKYFDAINAGDYQLWRTAVTPQWARDVSEGAWHSLYRSTLDGSIVVHRLEPRVGGGLVALTSFTSLQNPVDAPPGLPVRCLRWWVSYPLIGEGDQLRLATSSPNANLRVPC
jgi:hypothetical protein